MTVFRRLLWSFVLGFCLLTIVTPVSFAADPPAQIEQLQQENQRLHRQLRDARREIAQLRVAESEPGWEQIIAGLGIIFGLCGAGMMLNVRRKNSP